MTDANSEHGPALTDDETRDTFIGRVFGGDRRRYDEFVDVVRAGVPGDVTVIVRGSSVTGERSRGGAPFDADGPGTSDLDLTLVGGDMLKLWDDDAFYIPKLHTAPLNDDTPDSCPSLVPLRRALCKIAGRAVNIQATASWIQFARDVLMDQPTFTLIDGRKSEDDAQPADPVVDARA